MTSLEVTTHGFANGGEAVARADGRVVFVRGGLPDERLRVRITDDRKASFAHAEVLEVLDATPHRLPESSCAAARHGAGCCDLAFADIGFTRELKTGALLDLLTRIGRLTDAEIDATGIRDAGVAALGDGASSGWRVRTRLFVDDAGAPGIRAFHGSDIITGHACAQPESVLTEGLGQRTFTPGAELIATVGVDGVRHLAQLAPVAASAARDPRRRTQKQRRRREQPRGLTALDGDPTVTHRVAGRLWTIPVTGFWQAHRAAPHTYAQTVVDLLAEAGTDTIGTRAPVIWDLYGGVGVFAAAVLDDGGRAGLGPRTVHIVDSDGAALAAATSTFDDDPRVITHRGEVASVIATLPTPDVVLLDPPRTGAGARVVEAIAAADPPVVVHVGCDLARFARDLRSFAENGYRVAAIRGFDAFPGTHHAEAIACLVRSGSGVSQST